MKVMIFGANGMLGRAIQREFRKESVNLVTVARNNADYLLDIKDFNIDIEWILDLEMPDIVINTLANINLTYCDRNPAEAYLINAYFPGKLSEICMKKNIKIIQISTDHYYSNDGIRLHKEEEPIFLLNEYARTKYIGEVLTGVYNKALIVRTNIIGFKGQTEKSTFIEWVLRTLEKNEKICGFTDFFTSSIDVEHFSKILYRLICKQVVGIINIGSLDVSSKYNFIHLIAKKMNKEHLIVQDSLNSLQQDVRRADTLGLDVQKLIGLVGKDMIPTTEQVVEWVIHRYKEGDLHEVSK